MPTLREQLDALRRLAPEQRRRRNLYRRKTNTMSVRLKKTLDRAKTVRKKVMDANSPPGERVLEAAKSMLGKTEVRNNDAPWLVQMEADVLAAGSKVGWMIPGNPYCGLGVMWSYLKGLGILLPDGMVYTPNILNYAGMTFRAKDGSRYRLYRVPPSDAKPGAIVVFDWSPGSGADHTGLARGPLRSGVMSTREFNTSPTNAGSQSNGGGVFDRTRFTGNILGVLNVTKVS